MKQTAVQWLVKQLDGYESDCEIFQIAKQMEKDHIIQARTTAPLLNCGDLNSYKQEAEQYYNETFRPE